MDGIQLISANELIGHKCPIGKKVSKTQFKTIISYENGRVIEIPDRGIKAFPKRAILRIRMILQNSKVSPEIREQLLNILEKTSDETKTHDINEEQSLMLSVGMAVASGDATAVAIASAKVSRV
ncbi:MAG: hypothetical protein K2O91_08645 [Lachnospiraceae bacterium]|nr:hypothetical protein [Lachnospiraceae bacterium]